MKNFHKMVTPPYCICEILIQIFTVNELVQGVFFNWYPPENSKCQLVSKFRHLELFDGVYYVIWHLELLGGTSEKNHPV